jgi:hypothetical protein
MKTLLDLSIKIICLSIIFILLFPMWTFAQQGVAISTDGSSADPSAMLHVIAEHKGVLIPNLILNDTATADPVMDPSIGLLIYNGGGMEPHGFYYWDGNQWQPLLAGKLAILSDNDADTRIEMDDGTDPDEIAFIIDTNEVMRLDSKTLHLEAPGGSLFIGKGAGANDDGTDNRNTFIGSNAGHWNTGGYNNTAIGDSALYGNPGPQPDFIRGNTAVGSMALHRIEEGEYNTAIGSFALYANHNGVANTAIGFRALQSLQGGEGNTAIGSNVLQLNVGYYNTAIGDLALSSNITGSKLVAVGYQAGFNDTSGTSNTYIGHRAGYNALSGSENTYLGDSSGYHNATGSRNIFIGKQAGFGSETGGDGDGNVALGTRSLFSIEYGKNNIAIGDSALFHNTIGDRNTAIGSSALEYNTIGSLNTAIGYDALVFNSTGYHNTAIGPNALLKNTSGFINIAIGNDALRLNTTGFHNTAIGSYALLNNTSGHFNIAIGTNAIAENITGSYNTALGEGALRFNTTGFHNTAIGYNALFSNTTGCGNVGIGDSVSYNLNDQSGIVAVGSNAGFNNALGERNTFIGFQSGYNTGQTVNNFPGNDNVFVGYLSGYTNDYGLKNTYIGKEAGYGATGNNNIFVGHQAGMNETGNGKLYIEPTSSGDPLIYGDFENDRLTVHGQLGIGTKTPDINVHITGNSDALLSSGTGMLMMGDLTGANLVMDNNEIMARNNGASSKLYMQYFGGDIQFGSGSGNPHLDIQGSLAVNSSVKKGKIFINGGSTSNPSIYMAGSPADIAYKTGQRLQIGQWDEAASWTTRLLLDTDGKLGIGTESPKYPVHFHHNSTNGNYLSFTNTNTGALGTDGVLVGLDDTENFRIHHYEAKHLDFYSNNTFRMRIESDGNIGIGTNSPEEMLHVNGNAQFDGPFAVQPAFDLWLDADNKLSVSTSDARLKENVETLTGALDKVTKLRGVSYTWINSPETGTRHGLIAQEVREVIPDLVYKTQEYYGLNYSELSGFFVEAIKEQQQLIQNLQSENKALKTALNKFEERMVKLERTYENNN